MSYISRVLANFVWKSSVGYHGNKGQSEANFDDAVKLPDPGPKTPALVQTACFYL